MYTEPKETGNLMSDCINWTGYCMPRGSGQVQYQGRVRLAHRVAYEKANGPIPKGLVVRHSCDNPSCVNIDHLLLGTQADNMQDKVDRGRSHTNIKVTGDIAEDIRGYLALGWTQSKVADFLGISQATVSRNSKGNYNEVH